MRTLPVMMAALALCVFPRWAGAQMPGPWFAEVSAAHVLGTDLWLDTEHPVGSGVAWDATVGRRTLPWLAITGEVGVLAVTEAVYSVTEDGLKVDDATHTTLMTGVRLEPAHRGLVFSLELGTGLGLMRWGDRLVTFASGDDNRTFAGDHDVAWGWSAGLRLRFATRRRLLLPQAIGRVVVFHERGEPVLMTTLGLGLRY